jgi:hypothetical protein
MRRMALASAQVSHRSHNRLLRLTSGETAGTRAGGADATEGPVPRNRLPTSSITAVATGGGKAGGGAGRASGGRFIGGVVGGTDATGGGVVRRSWSNETTSSNRRTRCSSDGATGSSSAGASEKVGSCGVSGSACEAGGPPSSAMRARAVSSSPFEIGREAGIGETVSVAASGGVGAESVRGSLGGTAFFLRAARSVLLFDIFTLALIPNPWGTYPHRSSIPAWRFLFQPAALSSRAIERERNLSSGVFPSSRRMIDPIHPIKALPSRSLTCHA